MKDNIWYKWKWWIFGWSKDINYDGVVDKSGVWRKFFRNLWVNNNSKFHVQLCFSVYAWIVGFTLKKEWELPSDLRVAQQSHIMFKMTGNPVLSGFTPVYRVFVFPCPWVCLIFSWFGDSLLQVCEIPSKESSSECHCQSNTAKSSGIGDL